MRLGDLVKTIDQMTDEELLERLRHTRNQRTTVRPAFRAHVERADKKATRAKANKTASLLDSLSDEEKLRLIEQLQQGELDV